MILLNESKIILGMKIVCFIFSRRTAGEFVTWFSVKIPTSAEIMGSLLWLVVSSSRRTEVDVSSGSTQ